MALTTPRTPFTEPAICAARSRRSIESTVPERVTTPCLVLTPTFVRFDSLSAVSFALISVVITVSSMVCPTVRDCAGAAITPAVRIRARTAAASDARRNEAMALPFRECLDCNLAAVTNAAVGVGGARHGVSPRSRGLSGRRRRRARRHDRQVDHDAVALADIPQGIRREARLERVAIGFDLHLPVAIDVVDRAVEGLPHAGRYCRGRRLGNDDRRRWGLRDDGRRWHRLHRDVAAFAIDHGLRGLDHPALTGTQSG